jgi:UDP-glucose:(heptosyl)LPS alpha-1,3-glucosyltransferase
MKPYRLAIVRQKYRPDGGAERFVSRALEALEGENLELNVITREWQGERNENWHIHICNPAKLGRISRERGFARSARELWLKEKFDLVQSHERIAGCDIYRAGDGVHQRWLSLRAQTLPAWRRALLMNDRYHRYVVAAERAMYQSPQLRAVICNAEMVKREIIETFGFPEEKIHVIYNAIDSSRFLPAAPDERQALRDNLAIPHQAVVLVFVGSGFDRKGLASAIKAIAPTNRYLLIVGQDKNEQQYRKLAQSLGCLERIRFMGVQKQTLPFYQAADGLLLPTKYDPFPNVILEAMACGLPVITTPTCGGSEFIVDQESGFICGALDINQLIQAVSAIPSLNNDNKMGELARVRVKNETPARLSQQLITLYKNLLE